MVNEWSASLRNRDTERVVTDHWSGYRGRLASPNEYYPSTGGEGLGEQWIGWRCGIRCSSVGLVLLPTITSDVQGSVPHLLRNLITYLTVSPRRPPLSPSPSPSLTDSLRLYIPASLSLSLSLVIQWQSAGMFIVILSLRIL